MVLETTRKIEQDYQPLDNLIKQGYHVRKSDILILFIRNYKYILDNLINKVIKGFVLRTLLIFMG